MHMDSQTSSSVPISDIIITSSAGATTASSSSVAQVEAGGGGIGIAQVPGAGSGSTSPQWSRTSKACANCRRDKIRCDGSRPCTSCTKKGYAADQCIDGCEPCRRARTRCEGGKPCMRCRDQGLACQDDFLVNGGQGPSAGGSGVQDQAIMGAIAGIGPADGGSSMPVRNVRSGGERAKLACTNCRRDNKKCDDQRPCPRCVTRGEECVHVGRGPKLVKLRCEACRKDNKRCEEMKPCSYCVEQKVDCITQPRKGRGHGTRVKAACMSCRRDKIRCDGIRPCSSCVRKGFDCIDRACKACAQDGRAAECTHRKGPEATSGTEEGRRGAHWRTPSDSSTSGMVPSPIQPHQSPTGGPPPFSLQMQPFPPPPGAEQLYSLASGVPQFYYHPTSQSGTAASGSNIGGPAAAASLIYLHQQQRPVEYYPMIDPSITDDSQSGSPATTTARMIPSSALRHGAEPHVG